MASIKCSKCGSGIHYHDEPDGTEWTVFSLDVWECLLKTNKEICEYKTTAECGWYSIWECGKCGSLHVFECMDIHLKAAYERSKTIAKTEDGKVEKCIAFMDYEWDEITENDWNGSELKKHLNEIPHVFMTVSENEIVFYKGEDYTVPEERYTKIIPE